MPNEASPTQRCAFCLRPKNEVLILVGDEGSSLICDRCAERAFRRASEALRSGDEDAGEEVLALAAEDEPATKPLPKPTEIKKFLDDYVIAQDRAKTDIALAVYDHYKQREHYETLAKVKKKPDVEVEKSNVLLIGPTGTGKTHLARAIARMLNVPFHSGDATSLTQAGYVGADVESLLQGLLRAADGDVQAAEWGIVYLDEVDKLARNSGKERAGFRDVSGEGVQQALLKILEGTMVSFPAVGKAGMNGVEFVEMDTRNVLFICAGSFAGIEPIVKHRLNKGASVGFGAAPREKYEDSVLYRHIEEADILDFGMIPEFLGRVPVLTSTYELSEEDMVKVLSEPKHSLMKQEQALFEMDGIELRFTDDALRAIAREAKRRPTGARALRSILKKVVKPFAFSAPSDPTVQVIIVDEATVRDGAEPKYVRKDAA